MKTLPPMLESDVVLDWLESLGGTKLVEHTFRVFAKELESESLADLRQRISDNLACLMSEADQQAELHRAFVQNRNSPPLPANQSRRNSSQLSSSFTQSARPLSRSTLSPPLPAPNQTLSPGHPCKLSCHQTWCCSHSSHNHLLSVELAGKTRCCFKTGY